MKSNKLREFFLLTFGPVIRKLFTDLEERKNHRAWWRYTNSFLLPRVVRITSANIIDKKKGKMALPRKNYA